MSSEITPLGRSDHNTHNLSTTQLLSQVGGNRRNLSELIKEIGFKKADPNEVPKNENLNGRLGKTRTGTGRQYRLNEGTLKFDKEVPKDVDSAFQKMKELNQATYPNLPKEELPLTKPILYLEQTGDRVELKCEVAGVLFASHTPEKRRIFQDSTTGCVNNGEIMISADRALIANYVNTLNLTPEQKELFATFMEAKAPAPTPTTPPIKQREAAPQAASSAVSDSPSSINMCVLTADYSTPTLTAKSTIETVDTLRKTKQILSAEYEFLSAKLADPHLGKVDKSIVQDRMEKCLNMMEACAAYDGYDKPVNMKNMSDVKEWLGSYYWRSTIMENFIACSTQGSKNPHIDAYRKSVNEFIAAPVNFRIQSITCGDKTSSILRCGVLYDPTNPFTHLNELKEIQKKGPDAIQAKRQEIQKIQDSNRENPFVVASTGFALEQLSDTASLDKTIRERENNLTRQALQVVWAQLEIAQQSQEPFPDGKLKMSHVTILNEDNISIDKSVGWYHHEGNEIQDMAAVYKLLDNKQILFDNTGPYIDDKGQIHMPFKAENGPDTIKLETAFFNISTQGRLRNKGVMQSAINQESAAKVGIKIPKKTYTSVEQVNALNAELEANGFQSGISCLSAKDRTGWTLYQYELDKLESHGVARPSGFETPGYKMLADVLEQNYGKRILKVVKAKLRDVGKMEHGGLAVAQLRDTIEGAITLLGRNGRNITIFDAESTDIGSPRGSEASSSSSSGSDSEER